MPTRKVNALRKNTGTAKKYRPHEALPKSTPKKPSTRFDAPLEAVDDDPNRNGSVALQTAKRIPDEPLRTRRNDLQNPWKDFSAHIKQSRVTDSPLFTSLQKRLLALEQEEQSVPIEKKVLPFLATSSAETNTLPSDSTLPSNLLDLIDQKPGQTDPRFRSDSLLEGGPDRIVNPLVFACRKDIDAVKHPLTNPSSNRPSN